MDWMNSLELESKYSVPDFKDNFLKTFTFSFFLRRGLISADYVPSDAFRKIVILTLAGEAWAKRLGLTIKDISEEEIKLALFMIFAYRDIFIDCEKTKLDEIRKILDSEIIGGRIRYPWVYDRLLYDRFFDTFTNQTDELSYEETQKLLKDTPNGVFQLKDIIVGPFGVLNSFSSRLLYPRRKVLLWHCSDPSCPAFHPVILNSGNTNILRAKEFVMRESFKEIGIPSEWEDFFSHLSRSSNIYYDDMNTQDLPWLFVNAFSEREIKSILGRLIEQHSEKIRQKFPKTNRFKSILTGTAKQISEQLTKYQCFQLILVMSDADIVEGLEYLIENGVINIPSTERRNSKYSGTTGYWFGIASECSKFGVRFIARRKALEFSRLKALIKNLYFQEGRLEQLNWILRHISGTNIDEKLDLYLNTENPRNIINNLIIAQGQSFIHETFKFLRYGRFVLPQSKKEEEYLMEKIMWKLGFDIQLYPKHNLLFQERVEKFLQSVKDFDCNDEYGQESIRSSAINFFISLEEILEYSLSFITWALFSDHYFMTKFKFNFEEARKFMALRLSGLRLGSNDVLKFDANGKNTLYPLIQGFTVLSEEATKIVGNSKDFKRPEEELPGYHKKNRLETFPFLYKVFVLDIREEDCHKIINFLKEIGTRLEKSQIIKIRNRITHKGKRFPDKDEIGKACKEIIGIINEMELVGVNPLVYFRVSCTADQYDRLTLIYKDYKNRETKIDTFSAQMSRGLPSFLGAEIIVPSIHLKDSFEVVRFMVEESSDYVDMWQNYPKRKTRVKIVE